MPIESLKHIHKLEDYREIPDNPCSQKWLCVRNIFITIGTTFFIIGSLQYIYPASKLLPKTNPNIPLFTGLGIIITILFAQAINHYCFEQEKERYFNSTSYALTHA